MNKDGRENNEMIEEPSRSRKQITFDLSDSRLKEFYPRPKETENPTYHKKAWTDISKFMQKNGFEHRQYSVYASASEMSTAQVTALIRAMVMRMPWLYKCLNAIDVTNIGEQHSLMPIVEGVGIKLEQAKDIEKDSEQQMVNSEVKGSSLSDWKAKIEKEKSEKPIQKQSGERQERPKGRPER